MENVNIANAVMENTNLDLVEGVNASQPTYLDRASDSFKGTMHNLVSPETVGKIAAGAVAYYGAKAIVKRVVPYGKALFRGVQAGYNDFKEKLPDTPAKEEKCQEEKGQVEKGQEAEEWI